MRVFVVYDIVVKVYRPAPNLISHDNFGETVGGGMSMGLPGIDGKGRTGDVADGADTGSTRRAGSWLYRASGH